MLTKSSPGNTISDTFVPPEYSICSYPGYFGSAMFDLGEEDGSMFGLRQDQRPFLRASARRVTDKDQSQVKWR